MEITILEDRPNPLMKRREYRFEVAHATAATPSRESVRGELSKLVKAPKDRIVVERMAARYGTATSRGDALVYESADAALSITREHILVRNGLKEKATKEATPAAAAPAKPEPPAVPAKAEAPAETPSTVEAAAQKSEPAAEPKAVGKPAHKGEGHRSEHKPKAAKAEKDAAPAADA